MDTQSVDRWPTLLGVVTLDWCQRNPLKKLTVLAGLLAFCPESSAGPTVTNPDPPARKTIPRVGPGGFPESSDLDATYLWLGPSGAASHIDSAWDSTIGADAAVIRIRAHSGLAAIGGSLGGSRWTERGGGRLWLDALVGTRFLGCIVGASAGPLVELSDLSHPRVGGSVGLWAFIGVTPYVRIGTVSELGMFGEVGLHIALPVFSTRAGRR